MDICPRVHLVSNNVIKTTYLFVGNVPSDIISEIKRTANGSKSSKLESYYGKAWRQKIGHDKSKKGGSETDQNVAFDNIEVDVSDLENIKEDEINIFENPVETPIETPSEAPISQPSAPDLEPDESPDIDGVDIFGESNVKKPTGEGNLKISKMTIYPEDRISEFKEKIYVETGILPCKQHIYYISQKMAHPMSYQLMTDSRVIVDIRELNNTGNDTIEGLPIDTFLYKSRDYLKILSYDHFKTIGQLYTKHEQTEYFLVNLDDYINPIKARLSETLKDKFQMEMLYYGFIVKYWPMITYESFPDFFSKELSIKYPDLVQSRDVLLKKYEVEQKAIDGLYSIQPDNSLHKMSITSAILNIDINRYGYKTKLNIRNMFDRFILDEIVHHVKVLLYHNGKSICISYPTIV
jgi:hypothetical protein